MLAPRRDTLSRNLSSHAGAAGFEKSPTLKLLDVSFGGQSWGLRIEFAKVPAKALHCGSNQLTMGSKVTRLNLPAPYNRRSRETI